MKKHTAVLLAASVLMTPAVALAVVQPNSVNSTAIIDGEVKTADLDNQAITTEKITDLAVTDAKINDVNMSKVTGLSTALAAKADQATVDTALAAKANQATVDAALAGKAALNHAHLLGNVAVVATEGGEYTSPLAAMNDLANWCGTPSASNPCLIKVMPGVYDIGANSISLVSNVSIDGAGAAVTKIASSSGYPGTIYAFSGVQGGTLSNLTIENHSAVNGAAARSVYVDGDATSLDISHCTLISEPGPNTGPIALDSYRNTSVQLSDSALIASTSGSYSSYGLRSMRGGDITLTNVTIDVSGSYAFGMNLSNDVGYSSNSAIDLHGVTITATANSQAIGITAVATAGGNFLLDLSDVKIKAASAGISIIDGYTVTMNGVNVSGGYEGLYTSGGSSITAMNSSIEGTYVLTNNSSNIKIANSKLSGLISGSGAYKCVGNFDGNFDPVTCP